MHFQVFASQWIVRPPVADVGQVHQVAGQGAFLDLGVEILAFAAADGVDEVLPVGIGGSRRWARRLVLAHERVLVVVVHHQVTLGTVELVPDGVARLAFLDTGLVRRHPVTDFEGHLLLAVDVELVARGDRVRRFLVVVEHELATDRGDLGRGA